MSIIKCPVCQQQVSTMAGTCPHCNTNIAGHLLTCPSCGTYCLDSQDRCPACGTEVKHLSNSAAEEDTGKEPVPVKPPRKKDFRWGCLLTTVLLLALACGGYYYYDLLQKQKKEQSDYERLADVTNPLFYQQFLDEYPESQYSEEIRERMLTLQAEAEEWEKLQKSINRTNVMHFLQNHPNSLRQRLCEDMLDSIDWHDAVSIGSEEAVTDYLAKHPSGRYVSEAAESKNALLLSKVTPEERAMIRGTLESFFSVVIAKQDLEAAKAAIPDTMVEFCGKKKADAEAIVEYAKEKMAKDVIGLHYAIGKQLDVRKETLPDGNTGFAVEVSLQETISRSDANQPTSCLYNVKASLNHEQKIVRMNISRQ